MFDNIIVFKKEQTKKEASRERDLPSHMLSYDHNTFSGFVRAANKEDKNEFENRLKSIAKGR